MNKLSVIVPAYNEELMVEKASGVIGNILKNNDINYEIIFIDDGSNDKTLDVLKQISSKDKNIRFISFSRNFGKEAAIFAGLKYSEGDCCAVIDCDLQHPPDKLIEMYNLWLQGYEVIEGIKKDRGKENLIYRNFAGLFYKTISKLSNIDMANTSDYKLIDRKVVNILNEMPEKHVFFRALSSWVGFKSTNVYYEVQERQAGETKWSTKNLFKYALNNITSFSSLPLQIVTIFGIILLMLSLVLGSITLVRFFTGNSVEGFTTVILLLIIIGSMLMISLGIIGFYISKIYEEIKYRPRYIVSQTENSKNCNK